MHDSILYVFLFLVGIIIGYFLGRITRKESSGIIEFFLKEIDEDVNAIQCSVKPDGEWEELLDKKSIIFKIKKTQELQEALEKNKKGELL